MTHRWYPTMVCLDDKALEELEKSGAVPGAPERKIDEMYKFPWNPENDKT